MKSTGKESRRLTAVRCGMCMELKKNEKVNGYTVELEIGVKMSARLQFPDSAAAKRHAK